MRNLNGKEQAILDCIRRLSLQNGYCPSVRDIAAAMGYRSTSTVQLYLDRLAEYGYIRRAEGKSRSILLCEKKEHITVRCLRPGVLPSPSPKETDFEGELLFSFCGELSRDARLIAVFEESAWWVILQAELLPEDKTRVYVREGQLIKSDAKDTEDECVGALLAVIYQY